MEVHRVIFTVVFTSRAGEGGQLPEPHLGKNLLGIQESKEVFQTLTTAEVTSLSGVHPITKPLNGNKHRGQLLLGWTELDMLMKFQSECDVLETQLKSAEEECGRLVESVLAGVGG